MTAPPKDDHTTSTGTPAPRREAPSLLSEGGFSARMDRVASVGQRWGDQLVHSRRVRQAKVMLPILASAALLAVAIWPLVKETTQPRHVGANNGQVAMADAHYLGLDKQGRPIEVRAASAEQEAGADKVYDLTTPETEITLKSGEWVTLTGDKGIYNQTSGHLTLIGHVTLIHDNGYEFTTDTAEVDTVRGIAWGNSRIAGQGPFGDIDAGGFRIGKDGATVVFTGKARLRLIEAARKPGVLRNSTETPAATKPSPSTSPSSRREGAAQ